MSLIGTYSTFSVRGFGGIGSNNASKEYDVYIYSISTGTIVDFDIDMGNCILGIYTTTTTTTPTAGDYAFNYTPYAQLKYWYNNTNAAWDFVQVVKVSNDAKIIGDATGVNDYTSLAYINGPTAVMNGRRSVGTGTSLVKIKEDTVDNGYYFLQLGTSRVSVIKFNSALTSVVSAYYRVGWDSINNPTGYSIEFQDGLFVKIYGKPTVGSNLNWVGTTTSTYDSGNVKAISTGTVKQIYSVDPYCYIVYTNAGSIGLVRMDSSFNLVNNQTYTVSGQTINYTSSCIDYTNNYIYITYNYGSVDRIVKLSINGVVQWTRTLTSSAGGLLGIRKITTNNSGSRFYISTLTRIFEFDSDGSISGSGQYTIGSTTYTYSEGSQWINGSSNLLTLGTATSSWTLPTTSVTPGSTTLSLSATTPAISTNTY